MSASNLKNGVDLEDLKTNLKEFLEKYFDLKEREYHQVNIKINEPLADKIIAEFNIKASHYNRLFDKLTDKINLTKSLNDEIKKMYPNIEITNLKGPRLIDYPVQPGKIIHS